MSEESLPTVEDVRRDYRTLDKLDLNADDLARVVVMDDFDPGDEALAVVHPPGLATHMPRLGEWLYATKLLRACGPEACLLLNGGVRAAKIAGMLNHLLPIRKRKIVSFGAFVQSPSTVKRRMVKWAYLGNTLNSVWSKKQITLQAKYLGVPEEKFFAIAYKANHSKRSPFKVVTEDFVFAGGNSGRDYRTLFDAVRGTSIPVMLSSTRGNVLSGLDVPENVHIVSVREPEFGRLMATARFMAMAVQPGLIRGAGEATILNAMWQSKAAVVADDLSAYEYIQNGITGYVVPAGDVDALRERIVELWEKPDRALEMGERAKDSVKKNFQHKHFIGRLKKLATLVARA